MRIITLLFILLLTACATIPPRPVNSVYLKTTGGGIAMDIKKKTANIGLTVMPTAAVKEPLYYITSFGPPPVAGDPLLGIRGMIIPAKEEYMRSPSFPITLLPEHKQLYEVTVDLFKNKEDTKPIGQHIQSVYFDGTDKLFGLLLRANKIR